MPDLSSGTAAVHAASSVIDEDAGRWTVSRRNGLAYCALLILSCAGLASTASAQTPDSGTRTATGRVTRVSTSSTATATRPALSSTSLAGTTSEPTALQADSAKALASGSVGSEDLTSDAPCH
jgi:hypothetical protein